MSLNNAQMVLAYLNNNSNIINDLNNRERYTIVTLINSNINNDLNNRRIFRTNNITTESKTKVNTNSFIITGDSLFEPDQECCICYQKLSNKTTKILSCPDCKNVIHKKCMESWLCQSYQSCIFCRSDIWKHYNFTNNV